MAEWKIELHPENAPASYVVVALTNDGGRMWFAYRSHREAVLKLPDLRDAWERAGLPS